MSTFQDIISNNPAANRTLFFSLGFLLTFVVLIYFYIISNSKDNAESKNKAGLLAMAFVFFFYMILGFTYIYTYPPDNNPAQIGSLRKPLFILSGCVNICLILTIPFFSRGATALDKLSEHRLWNYAVLLVVVIYILALFLPDFNLLFIDLPVTAIIMLFIGVFIAWDFERRDMKFAGYLIVALLLTKILLQIFITQIKAGEDKFDQVNTTILFPAMIEAVVAIMIAFNWINGLRYKKLAKIYSTDSSDAAVQQYFDKTSTLDDLKSSWKQKITRNNLEAAIQSMILFLEKRNEHFEIILSIASRNTRNNTEQMKGILSHEEYTRSRNKIVSSLLDLIKRI